MGSRGADVAGCLSRLGYLSGRFWAYLGLPVVRYENRFEPVLFGRLHSRAKITYLARFNPILTDFVIIISFCIF